MKRMAMVVAVLMIAGAWVVAAGGGQNPKSVIVNGGLYFWLQEPGTATCIGGKATGTFPPCTEGTQRILWRRFVGTIKPAPDEGSGAKYFPGVFRVPGNCNLDAQYQGHCWGVFEGPGAGGGTWEGTWNGTIDFVHYGSDLSFVGHGSGSDEMDGLHLKMESAAPGSGDPTALIPFTARIQKID